MPVACSLFALHSTATGGYPWIRLSRPASPLSRPCGRHGCLKNQSPELPLSGRGSTSPISSGGYDIYPQQTLQPFALLDSLLRLKLATAGNLYLLAFDVSDRVIYHLETARKLAAAGQAYRINVPLDSSVPRSDLLLSYWTQFGDRIAKPAEPLPSLAQRKEPRSRAIAVHPDIVALVMPVNLNVVTHRPAGHWKGSFDLAVATNVLVYYSVLDQSLALANLQTMLRPGGLFLCHNSLLELPVLQMHSARVTAVEYSTRADDGDFVVHYLRPQSAARPQ